MPTAQPQPEAEDAAAPALPTRGWDVAVIPQSAPPEPDEPEYISEEPAGGVPPVEIEATATAAPATTSAPGPAAATSPAERSAAPKSPPPSARGVAQGSRYGEAVVREILNAQFINEETIAPRVTPQAGPSESA